MAPPRDAPAPAAAAAAALLLLALAAAAFAPAGGAEVLAKSHLESCARGSDSGAGAGDGRVLNCSNKLVVNMAVPTGSSGGEASLVAKVAEVDQENDTQMIRDPPIITTNKSAVYALYALTYIRDVAYKPEEQYVTTRKCEPDAGADVVKSCERLWDKDGHLVENSEPVCCPCGPDRRVPSSCGSLFDKIVKGKANTAHCLRFAGDWFHVFGIGTRSLGFSIKVEVKKGSSITEVIVGPQNRTVVSKDNFLRVDLIGDFVGYTSVPTFENLYLVTPRKGDHGDGPQALGDEFSKWMLLERVLFTLDGIECNKIGVGYVAYKNQPNFCSSPFGSCLDGQLWKLWEGDNDRINKNQQPLYVVEGRFQRINQHPDAGVHTFSVGVTEFLNSNLLIELMADDIEYVYQRSPGKIIGINVTTFEALTQVGTAQVQTKNTGKLEASYSLTFKCLSGISDPEGQLFIMKPDELLIRSFNLHASTDQASKYQCTAILKASDSIELDRAECQFSTTATVLDNGTQIGPSNIHAKGGIGDFFESIKALWNTFWDIVIDFFTGRSCSTGCSGFFNLICHFQHLCIPWLVMFVLLLATAGVLIRLLHQKGHFDWLYDWWKDVFGWETHESARLKRKRGLGHHHHGGHYHKHHHHGHHHHHHAQKRHPSHHRVLHRHGSGEAPGQAAAEGHRRSSSSRHAPALGVLHKGQGHKHSSRLAAGKAIATLPRERREREREHEYHHSLSV